jgi:hypothetical protein
MNEKMLKELREKQEKKAQHDGGSSSQTRVEEVPENNNLAGQAITRRPSPLKRTNAQSPLRYLEKSPQKKSLGQTVVKNGVENFRQGAKELASYAASQRRKSKKVDNNSDVTAAQAGPVPTTNQETATGIQLVPTIDEKTAASNYAWLYGRLQYISAMVDKALSANPFKTGVTAESFVDDGLKNASDISRNVSYVEALMNDKNFLDHMPAPLRKDLESISNYIGDIREALFITGQPNSDNSNSADNLLAIDKIKKLITKGFELSASSIWNGGKQAKTGLYESGVNVRSTVGSGMIAAGLRLKKGASKEEINGNYNDLKLSFQHAGEGLGQVLYGVAKIGAGLGGGLLGVGAVVTAGAAGTALTVGVDAGIVVTAPFVATAVVFCIGGVFVCMGSGLAINFGIGTANTGEDIKSYVGEKGAAGYAKAAETGQYAKKSIKVAGKNIKSYVGEKGAAGYAKAAETGKYAKESIGAGCAKAAQKFLETRSAFGQKLAELPKNPYDVRKYLREQLAENRANRANRMKGN